MKQRRRHGSLRLTDEQRDALEVRNASVGLVSGAGCGKTTVLTERFLAEIESLAPSAPLRSVVALTFTEKAARELRERVRRECLRRLDRGDAPAFWRSIVRGLEAAPIGTFHGFCGRFLRRFAVEARVDPGFAVLDEPIARTLRERALARCFRGWLARTDADLIALAAEFGLTRVREAFSELIADRPPADLGAWAGRDCTDLIALWKTAWDERVRASLLTDLVRGAGPCLDLLSAHECSHPAMKERRAFLLERLPGLADEPDPLAALREIQKRAQVQGGGTAKHWPSEAVYDEVKARLAKLRDGVKKVLGALEIDESDSREAAELGLRVARLAAEAVSVYEQAKRAEGQLDFDDLLHRTLGLLKDGPEAARDEATRSIRFLLVDEFQDTDPTQAEILQLLAGAEAVEGRLFLVGDTKQSIYRFRGARPDVFDTIRASFPEDGRKSLRGNFRSVPALIAFFNALFGGAFSGEDDRLFPGREIPAQPDEPVVEFVWAAEHSEGDGRGPSVAERRRVEARWLARRVAAILAEGREVRDRATGQPRRVGAGDIAFLFRTLNDAAVYEQALTAERLDYYIRGGSAFFAQQEVLDLINLLTTLEDPLDSLALAATLRSPFFGVSDEGLYWLSASAGGDLPLGLARWEGVAELSASDRPKVERAVELLGRWRAAKDRLPIDALIARALDESGYEAALLGEFLGARKRANVRKLVRLAREFGRRGGLTLGDFVTRLRADQRKPPREDEATTTEEGHEDAVQLMTIHQAKGLEFPIVVVPDLNRDLSGGRDWVAIHDELGPLVKPPEADDDGRGGASLGWTAYRELEKRADEAEALRLFYVAATRARDYLILSAGLAPSEPAKSPALRLLDDRFDRATGRCKADAPEAPPVRVTADPPQALAERPAGPSRRLSGTDVADLIAGAVVGPEPAPVSSPTPPAWIDLDALAAPPPSLARIDRLVRAILAHPSALDPSALDSIAARVGRALVPSATKGLLAEARDRLRPWLEGPLAREIAGSVEVRRAVPWALAWPPDGGAPTAFRGQIDLAYRDRLGEWCLVSFALAEAPDLPDRLRLLLSARAADALGLGPATRCRRARLGPGGEAVVEEFAGDEVSDHSAELSAKIIRTGATRWPCQRPHPLSPEP